MKPIWNAVECLTISCVMRWDFVGLKNADCDDFKFYTFNRAIHPVIMGVGVGFWVDVFWRCAGSTGACCVETKQ